MTTVETEVPTYSGVAGTDTQQQVAPHVDVEDNGRHVARVEVPAALRPTEHLPGTWKLRLSGPGAAIARPEQIGACLLSKGKISTIETWRQCKYYRLQNPFERYVSFRGCGETPALKHLDTLEAVFDANNPVKAKIEVFDLEERETRIMLQFVPPGATDTYVKAVLQQAGVKTTNLKRSTVRQDQWFVTVDNLECEVPHYIASTNLTSKPLPEDRTAIMVSVPGRPIKCFHCGQSGHWSNKCDKGRDTRQQRYLLREEQKRLHYEKTRRAEKQLEAAQEELQKQKDEQLRVDRLLLDLSQEDLLAGAAASGTVEPASGSEDSDAEQPDFRVYASEDNAPQGGDGAVEKVTPNKKASPKKQPKSPPGKRGPPRGSMSLHMSPSTNPRKTKWEAQQDGTPNKKPCQPEIETESFSLDDQDVIIGCGLGPDSQSPVFNQLRRYLFKGGNQVSEVGEEEELLLEDLTEDPRTDILGPSGLAKPAGQSSPGLTASGSITSFQRPPPEVPPPGTSSPTGTGLLPEPPGDRESLPSSPAPDSSTPFVMRAVRSLEDRSGGGKPGRKKDKDKDKEKNKTRNRSISTDRKKATPSPGGKQPDTKMN